MIVRKTQLIELPQIMAIYENARKYMRKNGNLQQWSDGYPSEEVIIDDIKNGVSYVVTDDNNKELLCVFAYTKGPDITYERIYEGNWPNNKDYYVIHRIAVTQHRKGVASFVYNYCLNQYPVLRIDTHRDNIPMQNSLKKNGFSYCGIIHLLSGDERLAFQKERI